MDLLEKKQLLFDPISKEHIPYQNLIIIKNTKFFLVFDIYTLIDWIISSNSLINPVSNLDFSKLQLKILIKNLYNKKIIDLNQKNNLISKLKNKYFKEVIIFTLSKNISIKNNQNYINNKLKDFFIENHYIHNKISYQLNNEKKNSNSILLLNNMINNLYNKLNNIN